MSRFANLFAGHVAAVHQSLFARDVSVTTDGTPAATTAVLHNARQQTRKDDDGTKFVITRRCRFPELESIAEDAVVTIDSESWQIDEIMNTETPGVEVQLIRTLREERHRDNYRR